MRREPAIGATPCPPTSDEGRPRVKDGREPLWRIPRLLYSAPAGGRDTGRVLVGAEVPDNPSGNTGGDGMRGDRPVDDRVTCDHGALTDVSLDRALVGHPHAVSDPDGPEVVSLVEPVAIETQV